MKKYIITENAIETEVFAGNQQAAMNRYFNCERAVKKMCPRGSWGDKRGSVRYASIRAAS